MMLKSPAVPDKYREIISQMTYLCQNFTRFQATFKKGSDKPELDTIWISDIAKEAYDYLAKKVAEERKRDYEYEIMRYRTATATRLIMDANYEKTTP